VGGKMTKIEKPADWFDKVLPETLAENPEKTGGFVGTIVFNISGDDGGEWSVALEDGKATVSREIPADAGFSVKMKDVNFVKMMNGELSGPNAFMTGKLKFKGEISKAMKLRGLLFA
jgi:putative sterol carrier protein